MSIIRRAFSNRYLMAGGGNPWVIPTNGQIGSILAGGPLDPATAMQFASVFACVRLLSTTLSGLHLEAVDAPVGGRPLRKQPPIITDPFGGEVGPDPLLLSKRDGVRQLSVAGLTAGTGYAQTIDSDRRGNPLTVQVISPARVNVNVDGTKVIYELDGEPVRDPNSMWLFRGLTWPGQITGISPITYARRTIELGIVSEEYGAQFFRNGASMSGVIEVPGALDQEKARQLKQSFESTHRGVQHAHAVGILSGGATWKQITISPEDAQFLGTQASKTLDIAMLYGVPPHMLGQVDRTTSWGKGIEEQTLGFLKYTVRGWTDPLEDFFSRMLPSGQWARFNFDELLKPDSSARYLMYQSARNAAILTINEIRAKEGLPPIDGGDDVMAPLNSAHTKDPGYQVGETDQPQPDPTAPPVAPPESTPTN